MVPMKLFYRTSAKSATQILREGFQDRADPTGTNLGFYDQIPAIKTVWFTDIPLKGNEDRLLVLEIPDNVVQQIDRTVRMGLWGRSSLPHFNRYRPNEREGIDGVYWANPIQNGSFPQKWRINMVRLKTCLTTKMNIYRIEVFFEKHPSPMLTTSRNANYGFNRHE